ncbi:transmembrane protein 47-like [Symsagittifera roscoffensis]|uniref:transmembrane protein 47-like n=1 Tax=Symsagittifera roscoffensis TaxID=84072 RepID=UPI00307CC6C5
MSRPYPADDYSEHYDEDDEVVTKNAWICRPFRLIGFICLCVAVALLIVSLMSDMWAHSENDVYSQGLWESCRKEIRAEFVTSDNGARNFQRTVVETCEDIDPRQPWLKSVIALVIITILVTVLAIIVILISLCLNSQAAANIAGCLALAALILIIVGLVVFLAMFSREFEDIDIRLDRTNEDYYISQERKWYFGWGHGCGWAASILLCGAACLFLLCKVQDEIYEAEKTYKPNKKAKPADSKHVEGAF